MSRYRSHLSRSIHPVSRKVDQSMRRLLKLFWSTAIVVAMGYAVVAGTPVSAASTDIPRLSSEDVHTQPCTPTASLDPLVPMVATLSVHPLTVVQLGEDDEDDDDWDFNVECEGAVSVSAKADDGKITVKTCSVDGAVECTLSNDDADFDITLEGCITVTHESED